MIHQGCLGLWTPTLGSVEVTITLAGSGPGHRFGRLFVFCDARW